LLFVLFAGAGFAGMTLIATGKSGNKKLQGTNRQITAAQPSAPTAQPVPAQGPTGSGTESTQKVKEASQAQPVQRSATDGVPKKSHDFLGSSDVKGRDVFREFYIKHAGAATTGAKSSTMHLEQSLPGFPPSPLTSGGFVQALPPGQVMNTSVIDQLKEVKIYGITCALDSRLTTPASWECAAITSEGVLKKGDKLGSETVLTVNKTSFATGRRTVEFN
ncbi:MAG: hypothetical protein HQL08_09520, partial [Nitrospirae bacterium]|nr:hypothetical protein [Nitrospirota bacterium]